jgi:uncharacterized protein (DUF2336 family)
MPTSLAELRLLALDHRSGSRQELLCALADLLCDPAPGLAVEERALVDDIVATMLDAIEPLARREFAERLAAHPAAPHGVVARLAADVAAVAAPVLAASPLLDDDDLAAVAERQSQEHLLAIARRDKLSARITDILVARGDAVVLDALAVNAGACFSAPDALAAAARLREARARRDAVPARPLDELAALIADGSLRLADAVIELADAERARDVAELVCARTGGDAATFLRHLHAPGETALMAACRAAALDLEAFSAVLRLRHRHHPIGDIARLLRAFQALPAPRPRGA